MFTPFQIPFTGPSLNPARTLGPSVASNTFKHHWVGILYCILFYWIIMHIVSYYIILYYIILYYIILYYIILYYIILYYIILYYIILYYYTLLCCLINYIVLCHMFEHCNSCIETTIISFGPLAIWMGEISKIKYRRQNRQGQVKGHHNKMVLKDSKTRYPQNKTQQTL